jgi:cytochrome c2
MPTLKWTGGFMLFGLLVYLITGLLTTPGTGGGGSRPALAEGQGAEAARGAQLLIDYGCTACHIIPGLPDSVSRVGPSLEELALQRYLVGQVPNTPEGLAAFIVDPQAYSPGSAMPDLDVTDFDARDMVAYLQMLN